MSFSELSTCSSAESPSNHHTTRHTRQPDANPSPTSPSSASPGSELVFTYIDQEVFTPVPTTESATFNKLQDSVTSIGEPFLSGFNPSTLEQDLLRAGFQLEEDLDDTQVIARYAEAGSNRLRSAPQSRIARAAVLDEKS